MPLPRNADAGYDTLSAARDQIFELRKLVVDASAANVATSAELKGSMIVLSGQVAEMKNQTDDLRNAVKGQGTDKGIIGRLLLVEEHLAMLLAKPAARLSSIGVWIAAVAATMAVIGTLWQMSHPPMLVERIEVPPAVDGGAHKR